MKFTRDFLINELDLPYAAIENTIVDQRRWSTVHEIIFEHDGKFYQTHYSEGSTEMQDERPWQYDKEVECTEVRKVQKLVEVWEPVEEVQE